jgi:hypothetical protein
VEATIDNHQWYAIVKRCVRRERILAVVNANGGDPADVEGVIGDGGDDTATTTDSVVTMPSLLQGIVDNEDEVAAEFGPRAQQRAEAQQARLQQREQIREDRNHFHREKSHREKAAMEMVGGRRVNSIVGNSAVGKSSTEQKRTAWRDPLLARTSKNSAPKLAYSGRVSAEAVKAKASAARHKLSLGRWADLESGTAALDIADAFLDGPVGRELTDPSSFMFKGRRQEREDDFDDDDIVGIVDQIESRNRRELDASARSQANYLLHGSRSMGSGGSRGSSSNSQQTGNKLSFGHKTVRERESAQTLQRDARSLYAQGWRSSKGGWVADFGLPHTHALNRDEDFEYAHSLSQMRENFYRTKNDQKRRTELDGFDVDGVDDYTMKVANTIQAPTASELGIHQLDAKPYSFSSTRSPVERINSLREEFGLHHDSPKAQASSNAGAAKSAANRFALHSDDDDNKDGTESSSSTPINMNRPIRHDDGSDENPVIDVNSDNEGSSTSTGHGADRLLGNLQSSVSLKTAAR